VCPAKNLWARPHRLSQKLHPGNATTPLPDEKTGSKFPKNQSRSYRGHSRPGLALDFVICLNNCITPGNRFCHFMKRKILWCFGGWRGVKRNSHQICGNFHRPTRQSLKLGPLTMSQAQQGEPVGASAPALEQQFSSAMATAFDPHLVKSGPDASRNPASGRIASPSRRPTSPASSTWGTPSSTPFTTASSGTTV